MTIKSLLIHATTLDKFGKEHPNQSIAIFDGRIQWHGDDANLPSFTPDAIFDCQNDVVTPGLIDCHTHLVYAGNRVGDFQKRLEGERYEDIASRGGGILSTVMQTRNASEEELLEQSLSRVLSMLQEGVTTVEIKSGYGLDVDTEFKMLRVAKALSKRTGIRVQTTFLGAHALPPEVPTLDDYVEFLCNQMLPQVAESGLADNVDVFCERFAFSLSQTEKIFKKAQALKLPIKCHAEQCSKSGAAQLAASFGALSCDHLEYLDEASAESMAKAKAVAVLLPGAYYFLKSNLCPPIHLLRRYGVGMAIATDCNPGSSPTTSLSLMMNMACQFFSLSISEVLSGVTFQAARALNLQDNIGEIAVGKAADLVRWSTQQSAELCYHLGATVRRKVMMNGQWI